MKAYRILNVITSILFAYLFSLLMFSPQSFIEDVGLVPDTASLVIIRRAAIFMLGLVVLLFSSQKLKPGKELQLISLATAVTLCGLATMGIYEFTKGSVNASIIQAIVIESILGLSYIVVFMANRKFIISEKHEDKN